jgi:2-keto-4-pentenoate hydratase/2-oxohepta-3-ene-1,7-dioic acid hydratase in catechol pathway
MLTIEGLGPAVVGTIYGIGRNYADHAKELGNTPPKSEPIVFLKAASSIRALANGAVAFNAGAIHYEAELVVRVGQTVPMGSEIIGWSAIDAVGLGLDLTIREKQNELKSKGLPWTLAKSFSGSSIVSPLIRTSELNGQQFFRFNFFVEDELKQSGDTRQMLFDVPTLLAFLASYNTLLPGDLIFTGTPAGVGPIQKGQKFLLELLEPHRRWDGRL